jgi:hypothetical protein
MRVLEIVGSAPTKLHLKLGIWKVVIKFGLRMFYSIFVSGRTYHNNLGTEPRSGEVTVIRIGCRRMCSSFSGRDAISEVFARPSSTVTV